MDNAKNLIKEVKAFGKNKKLNKIEKTFLEYIKFLVF